MRTNVSRTIADVEGSKEIQPLSNLDAKLRAELRVDLKQLIIRELPITAVRWYPRRRLGQRKRQPSMVQTS